MSGKHWTKDSGALEQISIFTQLLGRLRDTYVSDVIKISVSKYT